MHKQKLRTQFTSLRKNLRLPEVSRKSQQIFLRFKKLKEIENKFKFSAYISINCEVDTKDLINFLHPKKLVYLPKHVPDTNKWILAQFENWKKLEIGPHQILQPTSNKLTIADEIEVALFPGLAFSKNRARLGYGEGVFDQLFGNSHAIRIGLAYEFQMVDILPQESHDLIMDFVITEEKVYKNRQTSLSFLNIFF